MKTIHFSPYEAYSAKLTKVQAGGDSLNIIPGTATFAIDARAQSNVVLGELKERISQGIQAIGQMHGVEIELAWSDYTPAAEVSEEATSIAREAILATVGEEDTHLMSLHQAVMISTFTQFIIRV